MTRRILGILLVAILAMGMLPNVASAQVAPTEPRCFAAETGHCVQGRFRDYWETHGGLAVNGYPLTDERMETVENGKMYLVQWFERVRMEYHPENTDLQYQVLLGMFGRQIHGVDPGVDYNGDVEQAYLNRHHVGPKFLAYWVTNGGLAQFGYPISEKLTETLADGKSYTVQYFERARFELHPEKTGTPYEVLLGQFGRQLLAQSQKPPKPIPSPSPVTYPLMLNSACGGKALLEQITGFIELSGNGVAATAFDCQFLIMDDPSGQDGRRSLSGTNVVLLELSASGWAPVRVDGTVMKLKFGGMYRIIGSAGSKPILFPVP